MSTNLSQYIESSENIDTKVILETLRLIYQQNQLILEKLDCNMLISLYQPKTKNELQDAVNEWYENKSEAIKKYGDIGLWDTSKVTDMSQLFYSKKILMMILVIGMYLM